jgi:hypothetical protein
LGAGIFFIQKADIHQIMTAMKTTLRKTSLTAGLAVMLLTPATAKVSWGVKAGISRSSIAQKIDLDYRSGWSVGGSVAGLMDVPVYERFSFRPEVSLVYQGGSFLSGLGEAGTYALRNEVHGYSLQIPLNIAFNIPISGVNMAVYGGPAFDFHLYDTLKTKATEEGAAAGSQKIKPFDFGVNTGISVEYKGVFFSISVLCGTTDRRSERIANESSVYQNNLTFSLGYFFR